MLSEILAALGPLAVPVKEIGEGLGECINEAIDKLLPMEDDDEAE